MLLPEKDIVLLLRRLGLYFVPCFLLILQQASRAQILDKATEYIQYMRRKNHTHQQDIDDLKRQNALLEQQGEQPRSWGNWPCCARPGWGFHTWAFGQSQRTMPQKHPQPCSTGLRS